MKFWSYFKKIMCKIVKFQISLEGLVWESGHVLGNICVTSTVDSEGQTNFQAYKISFSHFTHSFLKSHRKLTFKGRWVNLQGIRQPNVLQKKK